MKRILIVVFSALGRADLEWGGPIRAGTGFYMTGPLTGDRRGFHRYVITGEKKIKSEEGGSAGLTAPCYLTRSNFYSFFYH